jgi:hypothetical protein
MNMATYNSMLAIVRWENTILLKCVGTKGTLEVKEKTIAKTVGMWSGRMPIVFSITYLHNT